MILGQFMKQLINMVILSHYRSLYIIYHGYGDFEQKYAQKVFLRKFQNGTSSSKLMLDLWFFHI